MDTSKNDNDSLKNTDITFEYDLSTEIDSITKSIKHNKRCRFERCIKQSSFNLPTETKSIYCGEHIKENMINVANKKCIYEGCKKQPSCNLPTEIKGLYCNEHNTNQRI